MDRPRIYVYKIRYDCFGLKRNYGLLMIGRRSDNRSLGHIAIVTIPTRSHSRRYWKRVRSYLKEGLKAIERINGDGKTETTLEHSPGKENAYRTCPDQGPSRGEIPKVS